MKDFRKFASIGTKFLGAWVGLWIAFGLLKLGLVTANLILGSLSATGAVIFLIALAWAVYDSVVLNK